MSGLSKTKVVNVMAVCITPAGDIEEFVIPRNRIKLNTFNPEEAIKGIYEYESGEGPISLLAQMEF